MIRLGTWKAGWDRKVKRLGIVELKLAQLSSMALALIVAKLFPQLLEISIWWFVTLLVLCAVPVNYALWRRDDRVLR